jgi:hypothetical protein
MKKKYEIPEAEAICTELETGLLIVTGYEEPWGVMPDDPDEPTDE